MKNITTRLIILAAILLGVSARADTITLKDGTTLTGKYLGGTADTVRFETSAGMQIFEASQVKSMSTSAAPAPAPAAAAAPAVAKSVTIPPGTVLWVRMMDSVSSKSTPGANFTTKLETDLVVNGVVAVRAGTVIYGKVQSASQAGRARGTSTLDIRLAQMVPNGAAIPISTSSYAQAGENETRKTVAAAGVGAVIGNNSGNGSQGKGAAYGAGAAMLKPGQTLTIPPGTVLEFSLTAPVTIQVGQ